MKNPELDQLVKNLISISTIDWYRQYKVRNPKVTKQTSNKVIIENSLIAIKVDFKPKGSIVEISIKNSGSKFTFIQFGFISPSIKKVFNQEIFPKLKKTALVNYKVSWKYLSKQDVEKIIIPYLSGRDTKGNRRIKPKISDKMLRNIDKIEDESLKTLMKLAIILS